MNIFDVRGAKHFCSQPLPSHTPNASLKAYNRALPRRTIIATEGTQGFEEIRAHLLRDVERCLFVAASQYTRSFDLMMASSASWTYVTLYYGGFFAAKSLLGMFGGWVDPPFVLIEVTNPSPGSQELRIRQRLSGIPMSHKGFWQEFYSAFNNLLVHIDPQYHFAVQPMSSDPYWLVDRRNDINYDTHRALYLGEQFRQSFDATSFPSCLPAEMNTQYRVTEALITLAFAFAKDFHLSTDTLDMIGSSTTRSTKIERMILRCTRPRLESKINSSVILV